VQDHLPLRIDRFPPDREQLVDIMLLDPGAADLDFDARDVAGQAAAGKAHEDVVDIGAGDPLRLLDRLADRRLRSAPCRRRSRAGRRGFPAGRCRGS
jgi:hypothetical protein